MNAVRRLYNAVNVRNIPFDGLFSKKEEALLQERFEDVIILEAELQRRLRFRQENTRKRGNGPFYVWWEWTTPMSQYEMNRAGLKLSPPYAVFPTYEEALEWLDPGH